MTALLSDALGVTILFASIGLAVAALAAVHDLLERWWQRGLRRRRERLATEQLKRGGRS